MSKGVPYTCIGMCTPTHPGLDAMVRSIPPNICQTHQTTVEQCWDKVRLQSRVNRNSTILTFTLLFFNGDIWQITLETILTFIGWTESSDGVEKLEHIIEDFGYGDILIEDYDTYKVLFFNKDQMASIATEKEAVIFSGIYSMLLLWIGKSVLR